MRAAIAAMRDFFLDYWPMFAMDLIFLIAALWVLGAFRCPQAHAEEWKPPRAPEIVAMAAVETLVALDVLQTLDMNRHPERHYFEQNPLLGERPSDARIVAVGAAGGLLAAGLFVALPPRVRWVVPLFVGIGEACAIAGNASVGLSLAWVFP